MENNFFYTDKCIDYILNNISKIPDIYDPNEPITKNFVNNCCKILESHKIQIFVSTIFSPLSKNEQLISESFVDLARTNVIKNLKLTDNLNKIQYVYKNFKEIINKIIITEKILYLSYPTQSIQSEYLYDSLKYHKLDNVRIIKQYMFPFYDIPKTDFNIDVIIYNQDLNIENNNITFLNIKKIFISQKDITEQKEHLINKLGQFYLYSLIDKICTSTTNNSCESFTNNSCESFVNCLTFNFTDFINKLSDSIKKCYMCGIYIKHTDSTNSIESLMPSNSKKIMCEYCKNIYDKDRFTQFVMNYIIDIV